eukprot:g11103.t1
MSPPSTAVEVVPLPQQNRNKTAMAPNAFLKLDNPLPHPSPLPSPGCSDIEHWSPASTARSTTPLDVEKVPTPDSQSAAAVATARRKTHLDGSEPTPSRVPNPSGEEMAPAPQAGKGGSTPNNPPPPNRAVDVRSRRNAAQLGRVSMKPLRFVDRRARNSNPTLKVGPKKSALVDDAVPEPAASRHGNVVRILRDSTSPAGALPSEEVEIIRHRVPPSRVRDEIFVDREPSSPGVAAATSSKLPSEADGETVTSTPPAAATAAAAAGGVGPLDTVAKRTVGETVDPLAREAVDQGLVLPCAPSDSEKVMYHASGRWVVLTAGFISYCTLMVGMCLFTQSSAHFYWYGAPTVFALIYMCCHYFGVSMWGKDFDPDVHEDVLRKGQAACTLTVDVFLPVCNEPIVLLANTWNHVLALDYPHVTVHVLDDGGKDEVKALAAKYGFEYIRRNNRPELKKAGNLRYAFARTSGEAITIFDADFCPRPDFLRETLPYLVDPSIGIVQTPQFFRRREEQTWIEQGAGTSQESFYRLIQVNLDRFNAAVCVGSCAVYRRAAVEPFGGVAPIEHSEDMYTGYKMTEIGYKVKYLPLCLAMGICPDEPRSFFMQQYRWCMGSCTLILERGFWQSDISSIHKLCFFNGMLFYLASALFIFLGPMPILLLVWLKADGVLWVYFGFTVPAAVFALVVVPSWSKQDSIFRAMASHRVRVLQSYAHLFAIRDRLFGTVAAWVPSGDKPSRKSSTAYDCSVWILVIWNVSSTILIVGGCLWRATEYPWYHFVIPTVMAWCSCGLSVSTLWY